MPNKCYREYVLSWERREKKDMTSDIDVFADERYRYLNLIYFLSSDKQVNIIKRRTSVDLEVRTEFVASEHMIVDPIWNRASP